MTGWRDLMFIIHRSCTFEPVHNSFRFMSLKMIPSPITRDYLHPRHIKCRSVIIQCLRVKRIRFLLCQFLRYLWSILYSHCPWMVWLPDHSFSLHMMISFKFHVDIVCGYRKKTVDFQQYRFQNSHRVRFRFGYRTQTTVWHLISTPNISTLQSSHLTNFINHINHMLFPCATVWKPIDCHG